MSYWMQRQSMSDLIWNASYYTVFEAPLSDGDRDLDWEYSSSPPPLTPPAYRGKLITLPVPCDG